MNKDINSAKPMRFSPFFTAIPFRHSATGIGIPILDECDRRCLAEIATLVDFPRGTVFQRQGEGATCVYNLVSGIVKTSCVSLEGKETVTAFHFPGDVIGLAENGTYLNTATTLENVSAFYLPLSSLEALLRKHPKLELHFLCKVCHELREEQRHAILLASGSARTKIVLFLHLMQIQGSIETNDSACIILPMKRLDIANYTGLTIETVSRTFNRLENDGILKIDGPHRIRITNELLFDQIAKSAETT
ncbi:MAG: Crp/Fnr family transcriptional regulator [Rhizobiales bacterium]|nr:Crp/Fnr family transcriptional regulator [Hyphomicrobiales bacterium]